MGSTPFFISVLVSLSAASWAATPQERIQQLYDNLTNQSPVLFQSFTAQQRDELFQNVSTHSVAGLGNIRRYDHQATGIGNGEVGFCYGRAMTVHLVARKMGLSGDSIQKIFIAGNLNNGEGVRWRFHMATMVRGDDSKWYIIDPIMPALGQSGVLTPYVWMTTIKAKFDLPDGKDESHFFVTNPNSIMVDMRVVPALTEFEIQDRLIEPSFEPEGRPGFERIQLQSEAAGPYPAFYVSGEAQARYFIMRDEAPLNGKEINDFDFFSLAIVILYRFSGDVAMTHVTRAYQYNNYFVDLVDSLTTTVSPAPTESRLRAFALASEASARGDQTEVRGSLLYGFADPKLE